jgi:hypothetical protein
MANSGPKRLTAAQLKARGSRPDRVKARAAEEQRGKLTIMPPRTASEVEVPDALTDAAAVALFRHVATNYQLEPIGESVLIQACCALQRANGCRTCIDADGLVDQSGPKPTAHVLIGAERDARALFLRLIDRLGLLD